jgi:hypothetical protein
MANNQLNSLVSDNELVVAFSDNGEGRFRYAVSFENQTHGWVYANNKAEATMLADEYAYRFLNTKVTQMYRLHISQGDA